MIYGIVPVRSAGNRTRDFLTQSVGGFYGFDVKVVVRPLVGMKSRDGQSNFLSRIECFAAECGGNILRSRGIRSNQGCAHCAGESEINRFPVRGSGGSIFALTHNAFVGASEFGIGHRTALRHFGGESKRIGVLSRKRKLDRVLVVGYQSRTEFGSYVQIFYAAAHSGGEIPNIRSGRRRRSLGYTYYRI